METRYTAILIAVLVLTLGGPAAAQMSTKVEMSPGGQTIAGPGVAQLNGPKNLRVWDALKTLDRGSVDICYTVHNFNPFQIDVRVGVEGSLPGPTIHFLAPGQTLSRCKPRAKTMDVDCQSEGPGAGAVRPKASCNYLWRVDQYDPNLEAR